MRSDSQQPPGLPVPTSRAGFGSQAQGAFPPFLSFCCILGGPLTPGVLHREGLGLPVPGETAPWPRDPYLSGLQSTFRLAGNLGRLGYPESLSGLWPFTYTKAHPRSHRRSFALPVHRHSTPFSPPHHVAQFPIFPHHTCDDGSFFRSSIKQSINQSTADQILKAFSRVGCRFR